MKRIVQIGLWGLVLVLLAGCGAKSSTVELPGEGYTALAEVDGTCYLVENSGIIYTLDWDTGKKTVYYKAPADTPWVADQDMTHLYYMEERTLHCIDIAADQDTPLCTLDARPWEPLSAVTDHFLVYREAAGNVETVNLWCLDLETRAARLIFSPERGTFDRLLAARGDTIYITYYKNGPTEADRYSHISAIDLSTGAETVLADVEMKAYTPVPYNPLYNTFCNVMTDDTLYYKNSRYYINDSPRDYASETAVCAVPLDGGNETRLALTGAVQSDSMCLSTDAHLLGCYDPDRKALVLYRYDAATDTAVELTRIKSMSSMLCAVTNGQRYVMLGGGGSDVTKLVLGDLE